MKNNKKIILSIFGVLITISLIGTGTYAWFKWRTSLEQTVNVNLTATSVISFAGGQDITGILDPVYNYKEGISKNIKITSELPGSTFNLYFKINGLPEELKESFFLWAIYKGDEYIDGDNFENYNVNDNIPLLLNRSIPVNTFDTYTLYLWLDATEDIDPSVGNKTVSLSLYATGDSGTVNELDVS